MMSLPEDFFIVVNLNSADPDKNAVFCDRHNSVIIAVYRYAILYVLS